MLHPVRTSALTLALLCPGAPSQAQGDLPFTALHSNNISWPTGSEYAPASPFRRALIGCFNEDLRRSAIVLKGNRTFALDSPHIYTAIQPVSTLHLNDVAVRRDGKADGIDTIVGVGTLGLLSFEFDEALDQFVHTSLGSSAWNGARRVVTGAIDNVGGEDIIAISSDRMKLLVLSADAAGVWTESSVDLLFPGIDVAVIDHFPGGTLEFAVLTEDGLYFHDTADGQYISDIRTAVPGGALTLSTSAGEVPPTRLAWTVKSPSGGPDIVHHVDYAGFDAPVQCNLPPTPQAPPVPLETLGIVAGDWNGDGLDDLALPHTNYERATLLLNQGATQNFSAAQSDHLQVDLIADPELDPGASMGIFGFGELGSPGRAALVVPHSENTLTVLRELSPLENQLRKITGGGETGIAPIDPEELQQTASGSTGNFFGAVSTYDYSSADDTGDLYLTFDNVPNQVRNNFSHLEIQEWRQDDPTVMETEISATADHRYFYTLDTASCTSMWLSLELDHPDTDEADVYWPSKDFVWLQLRFVNLGAGNTVSSASPSIVMALTLQPTVSAAFPDYFEYLLDRPGSGGRVGIFQGQAPYTLGTSWVFGDSEVGSIVIQEFLPPFPVGQPPTPPAPETHSAGGTLLQVHCVT